MGYKSDFDRFTKRSHFLRERLVSLSMTYDVTLLILLAAVLHAGWNALIKISGDRIAVMAVVTMAGSILSVFALPFVDSPDAASWPLLALTIVIHTGYHFFLPVAYDHSDLGQVYPIARGMAPILSLWARWYSLESTLANSR